MSGLQFAHAQSSPCARLRAQVESLSAGRCRLLAVSKLQSAEAIRALHAEGQRAFGENYVQEALTKQALLADLADLEWHLIGPLQSNKARLAAARFDWIHSVDRLRLLPALSAGAQDRARALNVLIQVNVDDEASKHGVLPAAVDDLADAIMHTPHLRLRGLMAIPDPARDPAAAFARMAGLQRTLAERLEGIDSLSMGMSADFPAAIAAGATWVRIGTALFGKRG